MWHRDFISECRTGTERAGRCLYLFAYARSPRFESAPLIQNMNSTINATIQTLNDLIEVLKDGQHGFQTSARDVKAPDLAQVFQGYAKQRGEFASTLQAHVAALGADVEKSGSIAGSMHRGWINLKAALSTNEPQAVLDEAERGEDAAVAAYRKALDTRDLDPTTRELIASQATAVKKAHDHVRNLRDSGTYRKK